MLILTLTPRLFSFLSLGIVFLSSCVLPKASMALTAEEFLKFSKQQRAEDAQIRAEERATDLAKINDMIETGVKTEVHRVLGPIQTKNEERLVLLETEIAEIKGLFKSGPRNHPPVPQPEPISRTF